MTKGRRRFRDGAVRIADLLVDRAVAEDDHLWWPAPVPRGREAPGGRRPVSLWRGTAGVSLFLAEAAAVTGDGRYWSAARRSADWSLEALDSLPETRRRSFLDGGLGVVHVLCRMADISGDRRFLDRATETARQLVGEGGGFDRIDLFGGASGALCVLLGLDQQVDSDRVRRWLDDVFFGIVSRVRRRRSGGFRDPHPTSGGPVPGFAFGPSGVAYALAQVLEREEIGGLRSVVEGAFRYEDRLYDADRNEWVDPRLGSTSAGDAGSSGSSTGWCRGTAGIGMARVTAVGAGSGAQVPRAEAAIRRTRRRVRSALENPRWATFTLCHGLGGAGELFLLAREITEGSDGHPAAAVGRAALRQMEETGGVLPGFHPPNREDPSLFIGSAGVGHFLLRLAAPGRVPPILAPGRTAVEPAGTWVPRTELVAARLGDGAASGSDEVPGPPPAGGRRSG